MFLPYVSNDFMFRKELRIPDIHGAKFQLNLLIPNVSKGHVIDILLRIAKVDGWFILKYEQSHPESRRKSVSLEPVFYIFNERG